MGEEGWKAAMVVFHDAPADAGSDLEAHAAATEQSRHTLMEHLRQAGAAEEVSVPPATPLPSLLVKGSSRALEECLKAPSVKEVLPISGDIEMKRL